MKNFNDETNIDDLVDEVILRISKTSNYSFEELHAQYEEAYLGWYFQERYERENHEYLSMKALRTVMEVYDGKE